MKRVALVVLVVLTVTACGELDAEGNVTLFCSARD